MCRLSQVRVQMIQAFQLLSARALFSIVHWQISMHFLPDLKVGDSKYDITAFMKLLRVSYLSSAAYDVALRL